jgi:tRNA A22 N-methylase
MNMDLLDNNVRCEFIKTLNDKIVETLLVIAPNNNEVNLIEWLKENKLKIETIFAKLKCTFLVLVEV